ncbi:hypothetical protein PHMEG_00014426 [Phytophthora megakarya]|uniref:Uncharacterized protein n=1 Tax=Phytophthora megakarya TaxID=4795 RepID=A0A225W4B9_9STRA|nr:hypothetical protein PHMEG_00014426 [Phytophthora megakarya]
MYCKWGFHLNARWHTMNHAQLSEYTCSVNNHQRPYCTCRRHCGGICRLTSDHADTLSAVQVAPTSLISSSAVVAPAAASTLAGCFLNWYMHRIWETVPGKKSKIRMQIRRQQ